eukprot:gene1330-1927_t
MLLVSVFQTFETQNAHDKDVRIEFVEDTHKYYIDECGRNVTSVTTYLKSFFHEFDAQKTIRTYGRRWRSDSTHKYYAKSDDEIMQEWEDNRKIQSDLGTRMHERFELFYNSKTLNTDSRIHPDDNACIPFPLEYQQFNRFHRDHNVRPFRTEMRVFDENLRIAGSVDLIAHGSLSTDTNRTYIIYDWKRSSKELKPDAPHYNRMCKSLLSHMPDTAYTHYILQQNVYAYLLKTLYGMRIEKMYLVRFHPSISNYELIPVPSCEDEIRNILEHRRRYLRRLRAIKGVLCAATLLLATFSKVKVSKIRRHV